ncbi:uncharacterized protein LOC131010650 [Salvia miltiorrhiza]|uniref:uncharacterized protein LOC131010650 n=1 Tax=Salvia miltiorrhiza TaxID=226208 RepID=UPI0025AD6D06|nr:uncharacterized protein LOC131010650 [Salvia miltiorrhiza]
MEEIRARLHFDGCFTVDCAGRSGGLCMLWKFSTTCKLLSFSTHHIDMEIMDSKGRWRLTGFYGFPERSRRRESWNILRRLAGVSSLPWAILGDFNDLLDPRDKRGRVEHPPWLFSGFRAAILDCGLDDIPLLGYQFTWARGLGTAHAVEERLDRCMATASWRGLFPDAALSTYVVPMSDHTPIILNMEGFPTTTSRRKFRFENKWCLEPDLPGVVKNCWTNLHGITIVEKLLAVSDSIATWAQNLHRDERGKKKKLQHIISSLQGRGDPYAINSINGARTELASLLLREEAHWQQRAKQHWLKGGDTNTKFFHAMASARRKKNTIIRLLRDDGDWTASNEEIQDVALNYFSNLFDEPSQQMDYHRILDKLNPCINEDMNGNLTREFSLEEFSTAVSQMHPDKSPGPDGLNPRFYQKFWSVIGEDVYKGCLSWLNEGHFPPGLNHTLISLIPKVDSPSSMKELRPIALCNVIYKIVSKVLCNRLKGVLPDLIDRAQSAFVEGRLIQDNILIAFEAIHSMKRKTRGKFGSFAFKIDISKAYDRVDWGYLDAVLRRLGFCDKWRDWMQMCVRSVSYDILINGKEVGPITPRRGLRQGDPLSPYLFILCAEGLSAMIGHEIARGNLHGLQIGRRGPVISHLMFADDCIFFCRATANECNALKDVLACYEEASGQAINFQKSGILYSSNVTAATKEEISEILGVHQPLNTGRYLGLPSLVGRKKKEIFQYLKDRMWNRIQGWNNKKLSKAGKEILVKGVGQAIPSFCMGVFLLPITLIDEMEKMLNSFWWGNKSGEGKGINWMKWERMCVDKKLGGIGFRSLNLMNIAMLGKTGWRLLTDTDSLVCRVLKAKYFPNTDFLAATVGHSPSFSWRSICSAQDLLRRGIRWRIGDGAQVRVFKDPWLRNGDSFRVTAAGPIFLDDLRVHDVMNQTMTGWNVDLLKSIVGEADFKNIMSIPLLPNAGPDRMIWHYSNNGIYSVKSAYKLASSLTLDTTYKVEGQWDCLWKIDVPPKVKHFLWRAARDNLPSKHRLLSRGVAVGGECPICKSGFENLWHSFFHCSFAEDCWRQGGLQSYISGIIDSCDSFEQAFSLLLRDSDNERKAKVCMLFWQIWRDRNAMVWQDVLPVSSRSILRAAVARSDWKSMRQPATQRQQVVTSCAGWHPIPEGSFKCNVDAAFFEEDQSMGIGVAIRNHEGHFVIGKSKKLPGRRSIVEGELLGIKEALSWIKEQGFVEGWIENDSIQACNLITSGDRNMLELGSIADACRLELRMLPNFRIRHVRREQNVIAHCLAKAARDIITHHVWNEPPSFVEGHLLVPCSCVE